MRVLAIVGPTGIGKSEVAQLVAERLGGEIVSADSMQIYRGIDIGTGKVPEGERRVPHHCLDLVSIDEPYSAAEYQRDARAAIEDCFRRGVVPVVCGGTGLYVRAALDTMDFVAGELVENHVRDRLERECDEIGSQALWDRLVGLDPPCAELVHPNNAVRVVRALEMYERGTPYSRQVSGFRDRTSHFETVYVGLTADRAALYRQIECRIDEMLAHGWESEVQHLIEAGLRDDVVAKGPIGYPEIVSVIEGGLLRDDAIAHIKMMTRRYAKRQLTWFRADERINWIDRTSTSAASAASTIVGLMSGSPHQTELI